MDLKELETLIHAAKTGSFTKASESLHLTQSGVTRRIHALEHDLGVHLFERSGRTVSLTPRGWRCLHYAELINRLVQELRAEIGDERAFTGTIRMGIAESIAMTWLPAFVNTINHNHPRVILELDVNSAGALWRKIESGALQVVLQPGPILNPRMEAVHLGRLAIRWMASPRALPSRQPVTPAALQTWPVITQASDSHINGVLEDWFRGAGIRPRRVETCNSMSAVASLTTAGAGMSLLAPALFRRDIEEGRLVLVPSDPPMPDVDYWAAYPTRSDSILAAVLAQLAARISTFSKERETRHVLDDE